LTDATRRRSRPPKRRRRPLWLSRNRFAPRTLRIGRYRRIVAPIDCTRNPLLPIALTARCGYPATRLTRGSPKRRSRAAVAAIPRRGVGASAPRTISASIRWSRARRAYRRLRSGLTILFQIRHPGAHPAFIVFLIHQRDLTLQPRFREVGPRLANEVDRHLVNFCDRLVAVSLSELTIGAAIIDRGAERLNERRVVLTNLREWA